jgi:hypothetical protein
MIFLSTTGIAMNRKVNLSREGSGMILAERERERESRCM